MTALAQRLAARTLELVDIPSESGREERIREHLLSLVPGTLRMEYAGDEAFLFVPGRRSAARLVVLAGHYDTVPPQGNLPGVVVDGAVHGVGASDMKGGLAVAVELVRDLAERAQPAHDVGLLLFGREELPAEHNPLPSLLAGSDAIPDVSLAVLLEPTDGTVQAGCLGNVVARVTFEGTGGHAARPWEATNALAPAAEVVSALLGRPPRDAVVGGLRFRETITPTRISAGVADNVIPAEATVTLNFRYAPDRSPEDAERALRDVLPPEARLEILGNAPAGRVVSGSPLVQALLAAGARSLEPKLAWTNVADFTAVGIDAVNFGPGHTALAHRREERVAIEALVHAHETLWRFLTGTGEDTA